MRTGLCSLFLILSVLTGVPHAMGDDAAIADTSLESCLIPPAGAPSCGVQDSPGSSLYQSPVPHHVGNPIDVISGNKYQHELDYRSPVSALVLSRHYNSALADHDSGLGPGWRHTYQVVLSRLSDSQLQILQSDGRLIRFRKLGTSPSDVYHADSPSDGHVRLGERSVWYLQDGRQMVFQGSFLVLMKFADDSGLLRLHYRKGRLHTVTDSLGQQLVFHHVPGRTGLPDYDSRQQLQPAGALARLVLPGGSETHYSYGEHGNLISVDYPDGTSSDYAYRNADWPSHLTHRQSSVDSRHSRWDYDAQGRGNVWLEGDDVNGLRITREPHERTSSEEGRQQSPASMDRTARVVQADGRQTNYRWTQSVTDPITGESAIDLQCDNCRVAEPISERLPEGRDAESIPAVSSDASTGDGRTGAGGDSALADVPEPTFDTVVTGMLGSLQPLPDSVPLETGRIGYSGELPLPTGSVAIELEVDHRGKVRNLQLGERSLADLIRATLAGGLAECDVDGDASHAQAMVMARLAAMAAGDSLCRMDPTLLMQILNRIESHSSPREESLSFGSGIAPDAESPTDADEQHAVDPFSPEEPGATLTPRRSLPRWDPMWRYCVLPYGMQCEDLAEDLQMARLSRCVYGSVSCEPEFIPVSPEELSLPEDRFDNAGFNATLYRAADNPDHFILAFRGTDNIGDDWEANFDQAASERTRQYDLAVQLARDVDRVLPSGSLELAGHSLGGGLATIAAFAIERPATIFNAASVQPGTADLYGLLDQYHSASDLIRHIHTESDPITWVQALADDLDVMDLQTTPGWNLEVPNPDLPWVNAVNASAQSFMEGFLPNIYHSVDAVVRVLEQLWEHNCTTGYQ